MTVFWATEDIHSGEKGKYEPADLFIRVKRMRDSQDCFEMATAFSTSERRLAMKERKRLAKPKIS